ncbi:MAG: hypothetical protein QNJ64_06940 [Crocosphaera sp.]|nr:hypothetical protein [Crocosphaera sp.]
MSTSTLTASELGCFIGSQKVFKHCLGLLQYTEGVQYMAEKGEAYWLIDAIASYQIHDHVRNEDIQFWKLTVNENQTATLICERDTDDVVVTQNIEFTDFPLSEITLYLANQTLMLPSEY